MTTGTAGTAVRLERTIPAPPARVYRAWLDPETMRRWLAPVGYEAARAEVDERVGGTHRLWHVGPDGDDVGGAESRIVELVPDERIVLDWWFVGPDRGVEPDHATRLTIDLRPADGGTHLTLTHDRLDGLAAAMPEVADNVEAGWTGTLGRLADAAGDPVGSLPPVVSQAEWDAALADFVRREKEATRAQDALAAARRELPMVEVTTDYVLDGPDGKARLADLFAGRRQLVVYHFMFHPDWDEGCPSCSFLVDNLPHPAHLHQRDTTLAVVSRAPRAKLAAYQERMGWDITWYSSGESEFNYDFHATLDDAVPPVAYNFEDRAALVDRGLTEFPGMEVPGASVFLRHGDRIFHTYSTYARGTETFLTTFRVLDLTALGRQEDWQAPAGRHTGPTPPIRRHDEYDGAARRPGAS